MVSGIRKTFSPKRRQRLEAFRVKMLTSINKNSDSGSNSGSNSTDDSADVEGGANRPIVISDSEDGDEEIVISDSEDDS
jgi:hypothetical protein